MLRVQFKWFNPKPPVIKGIVTVSDTHQIIDDWQITVKEHFIIHHTANKNIPLPPICAEKDLMERVEAAVHIYYDGLIQNEASGFWIKKPEIKLTVETLKNH